MLKEYYILYNSFKVLSYALGWQMSIPVTKTQRDRLITDIIKLAVHNTPFENKIIVKLDNTKKCKLTS